MNKVILFGNLGADPELRHTQGGTAALSLRLATTESYLDANKERQERTEWHRVTVWGRRGEALGKILHKGDRILVEGSIRTSIYEGKDGQKRYVTDIVARDVQLSGRSKGGGRSGSSELGDGGSRSSGEYSDADYAVVDDEDIPF